VSISFLQLYNERIYDLLNQDMFKRQIFNQIGTNPKEGLKLKWNPHDVFTVDNLTTVEI